MAVVKAKLNHVQVKCEKCGKSEHVDIEDLDKYECNCQKLEKVKPGGRKK